jgi:hypothetical protein
MEFEELRELVLKKLNRRFQKIAMVVYEVSTDENVTLCEDEIHRTIVQMVDQKMIEAQGDILDMRKGEVRVR